MFKKSEIVKVWAVSGCGSQARMYTLLCMAASHAPWIQDLRGLHVAGITCSQMDARLAIAMLVQTCLAAVAPSDGTRLNMLSLAALRID